MKPEQISVQMYTLRSISATDFEAALKAVADIGLKNVELAGLQGLSADELRALLDKYGLKARSAHVPYQAFEEDADAAIADYAKLGCEWVIVPAPPLDRLLAGGEFGWADLANLSAHQLSTLSGDELAAKYTLGKEKIEEFCKNLSDWAAKVNAAGMKFGYHNHHFEYLFRTADGQSMYEYMLANSPIIFQADAFWAEVGGKNAAEVIAANPDRVALVHIKDGSERMPGKDVPFGEGIMDWDAIIAAADAAGVEYYVIELDNPNPADPAADVRTAFENAMAKTN
ncbi:MAG: sugar phosphate isomerase/epimerase [Thermomicrobiales bacterium]|nr:sugar phosphate isomerase/epimerase [Thermomicrobiales bacterium]